MHREILRKAFVEASFLVLASLCLGTIFHFLAYKSFPIPRPITPLSKLERELGIKLEIPLDEALRHHREQTAVFIDARSHRDYQKGHIKGSINISPQEPEDAIVEKLVHLPKDLPIITYCDGITCQLSKDLAVKLIMHGFDNVRVLLDGWNRWLKANGPVVLDSAQP